MHRPSIFRNDNAHELAAFIRGNGFGMLVAHGAKGLEASHLPFFLKEQEGDLTLTCHVAAPNPLSELLDEEREVLVSFTGPHGYISSKWYDHLNVPTWNYVAVHAHGTARLVHDPKEKYADICELVDHYESDPAHAALMRQLPERFLQSHLDALVGIRIRVERLEGVSKLSQNRHERDYRNIIEQLEQSTNPMDHALAQEMRKASKKP
jgi:transcriptional regulator